MAPRLPGLLLWVGPKADGLDGPLCLQLLIRSGHAGSSDRRALATLAGDDDNLAR